MTGHHINTAESVNKMNLNKHSRGWGYIYDTIPQVENRAKMAGATEEPHP